MIVEEAFMGLLEMTKKGVENLKKLEDQQKALEQEWDGMKNL